MEFLSKLIDIVKVPLKVLLPAVWLFSGIITLSNDVLLSRLHIQDWCNDNRFIFGIIFLVTSCLVLVYIIIFLKDKIASLISDATRHKKIMKKIMALDDTRLGVIVEMYNSPGYSKAYNYCEPIIQSMCSEGYLYSGSQQLVTIDVFTNEMPVKFTLRASIFQTLNHYKPKLEKDIEKLKKRIAGERNLNNKEILQNQLNNLIDNYNFIYRRNGGY